MTRSVELRVVNDPAAIGVVRDTLDGLGDEFGIPVRALMQLQVALDEILSNVVKYSWPDGGKHEFLVRITIQSQGVDLDILDDGKPFDPSAMPPPARPPAGQRPQPGGLGIHMIKHLVDSFAYQRIDGHNHTTLSKKCEIVAPT